MFGHCGLAIIYQYGVSVSVLGILLRYSSLCNTSGRKEAIKILMVRRARSNPYAPDNI